MRFPAGRSCRGDHRAAENLPEPAKTSAKLDPRGATSSVVFLVFCAVFAVGDGGGDGGGSGGGGDDDDDDNDDDGGDVPSQSEGYF